MSRILKMALYAGSACLEQAGVRHPDGIITATGKGNLTDTERFLKNALEFRETALNPTPFILSTYNAVGGALALGSGTTAYNQTFVHGGSSFESALFDARIHLQGQSSHQQILLGSFDEITADHYAIRKKLHYWKENYQSESPLWSQGEATGTLAGEAATFFLADNRPQDALLEISGIRSRFGLQPGDIPENIERFLHATGRKPEEVDLMVFGINGDAEAERYYDEALSAFSSDLPVLAFKHLCGEYETATGFALWLIHTLQKQPAPEACPVWWRKPTRKLSFKNILLYNHFRGRDHNFLMLSAEGMLR